MKRSIIALSLCVLLPASLFALDKLEIKNNPVVKKSYGRMLVYQEKNTLSRAVKADIRKISKEIIKTPKGVRVLFSGPPGTGKTLTASLLGSMVGLDVFRVDLSAVVSKYIGETEKNLNSLFAQAERNNWILFFDEADALFGKRTKIRGAHDRYANIEVSHLSRLLKKHKGIVILASNHRSNLEPVFVKQCRYEVKVR